MNKENLIRKLSGKNPFMYVINNDDDDFNDYYYIGQCVFYECNDIFAIDLYEKLDEYVYRNKIGIVQESKDIKENVKLIIKYGKRYEQSDRYVETTERLRKLVNSLNEKQLESLYNQMLSFEKLYHDYIHQYEL